MLLSIDFPIFKQLGNLRNPVFWERPGFYRLAVSIALLLFPEKLRETGKAEWGSFSENCWVRSLQIALIFPTITYHSNPMVNQKFSTGASQFRRKPKSAKRCEARSNPAFRERGMENREREEKYFCKYEMLPHLQDVSSTKFRRKSQIIQLVI